MSGHSKWSTIKRKKGAADAKRGAIFTRISKDITLAAREGGGEPDMNPALRLAVKNAKSANMPAANIVKAIKKGTGELSGAKFENYIYEGYGPAGVAILMEIMTDNKNRTVPEIRHLMLKHGGNLGTLGSASHNFNQLGVIRIDKKEASDEEILEIAVEAGADECVSNDNIHQIFCSKENLYKVKNIIERKVSNFIFTGIEWIPLNKIDIVKEKIDSMINFIEALEDDDDVQNIYTNFKEKNFN